MFQPAMCKAEHADMMMKLISGERERELATFDENRRAVGMLNPMHDKD